MNQVNIQPTSDGVAGLEKRNVSAGMIAFMIYCMCCAGAFGIEAMIPSCGPGLTLIMLIIIPVLWAIPTCMAVSEMAAFLPEEGGIYVWVKEAFGEMWGFLVGWWGVLSGYLGLSAFVVLGVGYFSILVPISATTAFILKVLFIVIFTIINLIGIKESGFFNTIFSIIILLAFALVTVVGFMHWNHNPMDPILPPGQGIIDSIGLSICIGIWMFCGYAGVPNIAGELADPKAIPKGFKIVIPLIVLTYLLPTIAGLASVGHWESWGLEGTETISYGSVLTQYIGPIGGVLFTIVAIAAQCGSFNTGMMACSRGFFVLADDNLCPRFLVKLSKNRKMPYWPILILAAVSMFLMNFTFSVLLTILTPIGIMCVVILVLAFVKLRKKYPVEERGDAYVVKGGKVMEAYVVAGPFIIGLAGLLVNGTEYFLLGFVSIVTGIIFYAIFKRIYGGLYTKEPKLHPINEKTHLAVGDVPRIGIFLIIFGLFALLGSFFLIWYEGSWGPEYYKAFYGSGLMSNFWAMINWARWGGIALASIGCIFYFVGKKSDPFQPDVPKR